MKRSNINLERNIIMAKEDMKTKSDSNILVSSEIVETVNIQEEQIIDQEENWTDIHEDFNKTRQQIWEQANITKQEAKEWIELGFKPWNDLYKVKQWKNLNFSAIETKTWLAIGLDKRRDWHFASWLRTNNHIPKLVKNNLEQLRNDYENLKVNNSQLWLEQVYPNQNIKEIDISRKNLKGELNLRNYQQLERLSCLNNKLTNIILPTNPTNLKVLNLRGNNFSKQDLSFLIPYTNLEALSLGNHEGGEN